MGVVVGRAFPARLRRDSLEAQAISLYFRSARWSEGSDLNLTTTDKRLIGRNYRKDVASERG